MSKKEIKIKADYIRYLFFSFLISFFLVFIVQHRGILFPDQFISPFGSIIQISKDQYYSMNSLDEPIGIKIATSIPIYLKATIMDYKAWLSGAFVIFVILVLNRYFKLKVED